MYKHLIIHLYMEKKSDMFWIDQKHTKCLNFQNILELHSVAIQLNSINIFLAPAMSNIVYCCYSDELTEYTFINFLLCDRSCTGKTAI